MKKVKKLVTVIFPKNVFDETKAIQKKYGIKNLSALMRLAAEESASVNIKTKPEKRVQVSFRLDELILEKLVKRAHQNNKSLAELIRLCVKNLENVSPQKLRIVAEVPARGKGATKAKKTEPKASTLPKRAEKAKTNSTKSKAKKSSSPAKKVAPKLPAKKNSKKSK